MKTNTKLSLIAFMAFSLAISSCKKDKKELPPVDESELITTIKLQFTNASNATDIKTYTWRDIDGDGGAAPVIEEILLAANTNYNMEIVKILNETTTPPEDITEEIAEEDYDHLFVYKPSADLLTLQITDKDKNNLNVGLMGLVTTGAAKNGTLQVVLRHQPGVKDGTEAPGSTDFDITFNVKVQ
ncbi:MAG: hypothetical protein EAZ15_08165 [Sphingobacteriales bacterium]|nr:MAG: hypothetical protein EAZ15_08165 [Sphingobacteriales bacterium]